MDRITNASKLHQVPHITDAPSIARHVVKGVESVEAIERDPLDQRRFRQAEIDRDLPLPVLAFFPCAPVCDAAAAR